MPASHLPVEEPSASADGPAADPAPPSARDIATSRTTHQTSCNLCEAICGIEVTVEGDRVVAIRGDQRDPLSRGHVCPKSVAMADIYHDPDRLRQPMRRRGTDWEPIQWDEAIELAGKALATISRAHGAKAVAAYFGNPTVHSLGGMTHGLTFAHMLGTPNVFSATSMDQLPHHVASWLLYGHAALLPKPDLDRTQHLLVFGANPVASNGSLMTAPGIRRRFEALRARGGRLIVVDPRRTETAQVADEHVFVRPGTDAAVLLAMVNVVLAERPHQLPDYMIGLDAVRSAIAHVTPEVASRYSRVPAQTIRRLALEFADAETAVCYGRIGVSTQRFGTLSHWAIALLNMVTANFDTPGGAMFTEPAIDLLGQMNPGHLGARRTRVRGLPSFGDEFPVSALAEEILTPGPGRVRGLITTGGNPVLSSPDGAGMDKALSSLDFMVAVDLYLNETTRHADLILPTTTALERDHYDLVFRSFAVRNTAKFSPPVFDKNADARHDWEIFRDLGAAYRRHLAGARRWPARISVRRAILAAQLKLTPRRLVDLGLRTGRYKLSVKKLLAQPEGVDLGPMKPVLPRGLRTRGKRINLLPDEIADDLARLRHDVEAEPDGALRLIGRRHVRTNNSWGHNSGRLVAGEPRHHLLMHPADAQRCGVANGPATLRSQVGEIRVDVQQTTDIMEGTVSLPHGYGHDRAGTALSVAENVTGASINDVTDPSKLDELSGNAAFCGVVVTVTAVGEVAPE
ncbi:molybdopterin-dependent oxidoreductase [Streptomyces europaeiscabiei]|uniref:molybdopterin-dependent oxidoreductase n=1 Tax=Streptomyces europaeiscabiei TaxID=146819 RepID=UPI002E19079B